MPADLLPSDECELSKPFSDRLKIGSHATQLHLFVKLHLELLPRTRCDPGWRGWSKGHLDRWDNRTGPGPLARTTKDMHGHVTGWIDGLASVASGTGTGTARLIVRRRQLWLDLHESRKTADQMHASPCPQSNGDRAQPHWPISSLDPCVWGSGTCTP